MLQMLRNLFSPARDDKGPRVPEGQRVYAVGDIHGRLDLFNALLDAIDEDDAASAPARVTLVLLGDLVDRGPASAGVIARARALQAAGEVRILMGNHEEMFLRSFESIDMLRHFLRHGGRQTLQSYGMDRQWLSGAEIDQIQAEMARLVPQSDRDFMNGFEDMVTIGDYAFVHAGIDPDLPLDQQKPSDLRWIREPFLSCAEPYDRVVVHGHTITEQAELKGNRIGVDTGAYMSGRLTAIALEGTRRRLIEAAADEDGKVTTSAKVA